MKPIIVRGGGDLATGTIYRLSKSGYPVIILESRKPSAIRRLVSFCQAVYRRNHGSGRHGLYPGGIFGRGPGKS